MLSVPSTLFVKQEYSLNINLFDWPWSGHPCHSAICIDIFVVEAFVIKVLSCTGTFYNIKANKTDIGLL